MNIVKVDDVLHHPVYIVYWIDNENRKMLSAVTAQQIREQGSLESVMLDPSLQSSEFKNGEAVIHIPGTNIIQKEYSEESWQ
jgi:hypothetical protein